MEIDLDGVRTWYDVAGTGDPLVYLHGGFSDSRELDPLRPRYAERFRVHTPDRRGHGRSPDVDGPFDFERLAADIAAFIEQVVGGPAHLVGFSDGATTALFAQVLAGYGIPVSHDRRVPLARTRLGAGVLAGARAALNGGTSADLLLWLRTPGRLADPATDPVGEGAAPVEEPSERSGSGSAGGRPQPASSISSTVAAAPAPWSSPTRRVMGER